MSRRIGDDVFKIIVQMAYEMNYANRYCKAERTNRFKGLVYREDQGELPFDIEQKKYDTIRKGDILVLTTFVNYDDFDKITRLAKVVRINSKSFSLEDCDQDGQLVEYNPEEDIKFSTKECRKNFNKLFFKEYPLPIFIITGTKHMRYEGWNL